MDVCMGGWHVWMDGQIMDGDGGMDGQRDGRMARGVCVCGWMNRGQWMGYRGIEGSMHKKIKGAEGWMDG